MPAVRTVHDWCDYYPEFAANYARARADGYDAIAADCLRIADESGGDVIETANGPKLNSEFAARSKIRIETRLRLLRSWCPAKYGDRIQVEDTTQRPQLTREEQLAQLQQSGLRIADVFATLTKAAEPGGGQIIDISGPEPDDLSGLNES